MKDKKNKTEADPQKNDLPGYPQYPPGEDIFNREKEKHFSDEDTREIENEAEQEETPLDEGLDVPGAELDDDSERIGAEDEENNYYSLGGDRQENLEENKGD